MEAAAVVIAGSRWAECIDTLAAAFSQEVRHGTRAEDLRQSDGVDGF